MNELGRFVASAILLIHEKQGRRLYGEAELFARMGFEVSDLAVVVDEQTGGASIQPKCCFEQPGGADECR